VKKSKLASITGGTSTTTIRQTGAWEAEYTEDGKYVGTFDMDI
jgi:hypothetical protein